MTQELPPPFVVGDTYLDRDGEYVVIAATGDRVTFQREDGRQFEADAAVKARIHRNLLAEQGQHPTLRDRKIRFEGRSLIGFRFSEVFPVIAATIRAHSAGEEDFVTHEELVAALLSHPELSPVLDQLEEHDPQRKPASWWASNMVAWFSQVFTTGRSEWEDQFTRQKLDGNWAYALAK